MKIKPTPPVDIGADLWSMRSTVSVRSLLAADAGHRVVNP
jgi:hypothetical protein